MRTITLRLAGAAVTTSTSLAILMSLPTGPAAAAPQVPAVGPGAVPAVALAAAAAGAAFALQGGTLRAGRTTASRSDQAAAPAPAVERVGWRARYGMQVHRWHGWTSIAGKDPISGTAGMKVDRAAACGLRTAAPACAPAVSAGGDRLDRPGAVPLLLAG